MKQLIFFLVFLPLMMSGQNWKKVGNFGLDRPACYKLTFDSVSDKLIVTGNFWYADSMPVLGIATWDGLQWDSLANRIQQMPAIGNYIGPVGDIFRYQGLLYASGNFFDYSNNRAYLSCLIGSAWQNVGPCTGFEDKPGPKRIIGGELFCATYNDTFCGTISKGLLKWNGSQFILDPRFEQLEMGASYAPRDFIIFNGELYVLGALKISSSSSYSEVIKWNGSNWVDIWPSPGGLAPPVSAIIFNNELYIRGHFDTSGGAADAGLMRWDGSQWKSVGGGVKSAGGGLGIIEDWTVYNGELYVVGIFDYAGGVPVSNIAKWDGTNWCSVGASTFDNKINAIEFYHDTLFVGGGFSMIDGDSVGYIAKWTGSLNTGPCGNTTNVGGTKPAFSGLKVYPSPANSFITLDGIDLIQSDKIFIYDLTGRLVLKMVASEEKAVVNVEKFQPGLYFVKSGGLPPTKFVKIE